MVYSSLIVVHRSIIGAFYRDHVCVFWCHAQRPLLNDARPFPQNMQIINNTGFWFYYYIWFAFFYCLIILVIDFMEVKSPSQLPPFGGVDCQKVAWKRGWWGESLVLNQVLLLLLSSSVTLLSSLSFRRVQSPN